MRMMARNQMSEKVAAAIDRNVKEIAMEAYDIALGHVRNNMAAMDMAVERLCEIETLTGDEFREIVQSCGITIPMENVEAVERQKLGIQEAEERLEKTAAAVSAAFKTLDAK